MPDARLHESVEAKMKRQGVVHPYMRCRLLYTYSAVEAVTNRTIIDIEDDEEEAESSERSPAEQMAIDTFSDERACYTHSHLVFPE
jgi:hypothetical protein